MKLLGFLLLLGSGAAVAASPNQTSSYEIMLDDRQPTKADFILEVPAGQELVLALSKSSARPTAAPECGSAPLRQAGAGKWIKPSGCARVRWPASIESVDTADFDASSPVSVWVAHDRLWLLTGSLPWLRVPGQQDAPVRITARVAGKEWTARSRGPSDHGIPVYIAVGQPVREYTSDGFTVVTYGDAPVSPKLDRLRRRLASYLAHWWRDIPPAGTVGPDHFNFVWFAPGKDSSPGIFASAGSDALLIQYVPGPNVTESNAKLEGAVFGVGGHEALHALFEAVPGFGTHWATWAAESLPTYFAYQAARKNLKGASLALFSSEIVNAPSAHALLKTEEKTDAGDESEYNSFYGRGARFWAAIEHVLTIAPNRSGRLAALIQQTNGMQGMVWRNADSVAAYLDRYSSGRAGPIVRCFLVEDSCARANRPIL